MSKACCIIVLLPAHSTNDAALYCPLQLDTNQQLAAPSRGALGCCNVILPPPAPLLLLQEYLESRRVAQNAVKAAQLSNDLHGLEAEMSRLNLKLWTQVLHELAPGGAPLPCKGSSCMTEHRQGQVPLASATSTCSVAFVCQSPATNSCGLWA